MDLNSRFLLRSFRKYYKNNAPILPERFGRREFGFMPFDRPMMQRHISFSKVGDVRKYLIAQVPAHAYYSTAYFRDPGAPTMDEKTWLGADLIFDLDADHLKGADKMTYSEMLLQIKKEMINLVDSFICGDLGFSENEVSIVFSGGRGYHAHISTPSVLSLTSPERREIVDYVTSKNLDIDWVFKKEMTVSSKPSPGQRSNVKETRTVPSENSGGWRLRMRNGLKEVAYDIIEMEPEALKERYPSLSGETKNALIKLKEAVSGSKGAFFDRGTMATLDKKYLDIMMNVISSDMVTRLSGEVDEPVTADIKRLIRLPGSLHGKSGLRVTPLSRDQLTDFDPLNDAVPGEYSDAPVKIVMRRDADITIRGERFSLTGETEIPEFAAVFLIGRKMADYGVNEE